MKRVRSIFIVVALSAITGIALAQASHNVQQIGLYDTPSQAMGVTISGNYAYVADYEGGLRVVDIANPNAPFEVGSYDTPGLSWVVAVQGNYAYVADLYSLRVINIANPAVPFETGFFDMPGGDAYGVAVSGNYAYVANGSSGLRVVNITNPAAPFETGHYDITGAGNVVVSGNYAYLAAGTQGLRIVNIANPSAPFEVGFYDTPGSAHRVVVSGHYAYIADYDQGLRVVNIANPSAPFEVGFCNTQDRARYVEVAGNCAYVGDNLGGLRLVNIFDPAHPVEIGYYVTPDRTIGIAVRGNIAYVASVSDLGIYDCSAALDLIEPVELLSFSAVPGDTQVQLRWQTASESGSDHFEIERNGVIAQRISAAGDATGHSYLWTDRNVSNGQPYHYKLWAVEVTGERNLLSETDATPTQGTATITEYALHGNYPNPFNPATEIAFDLPEAGYVSLKVFDLMGREITLLIQGEMPAGKHMVSFDARDLPSGMYLCRMTANEFTSSTKMMLLR